MVECGLRPTDPVRWFLAYSVERQLAEEQHDAEVVPDAH